MAQESLKDYYEQAKDIAKAEKSLKADRWVKIFIEREIGGDPLNRETLFTYDLPRKMTDKYEWVFRWRRARFQCEYPRDCVIQSCYFYRKVEGVDIGMQKDLNTLISAKAQLSKQERVISEYRMKKSLENDMFYNEESDDNLQQALAKLEKKRRNIQEAENRLKEKVIKFTTKRTECYGKI